MAICIQTNVWICTHCKSRGIDKTVEAISHEVSPFEDPVVIPPEGWGFIGEGTDKEEFVCTACVKKENSKNE